MSSTTLEWFIAQRGNFNWSSQPFATTIKSMINTEFHEWGFVIYRCVYGDDEAWQRYMKYFEEGILEELGHDGGDAVVGDSPARCRLMDEVNGPCSRIATSIRQMDGYGGPRNT